MDAGAQKAADLRLEERPSLSGTAAASAARQGFNLALEAVAPLILLRNGATLSTPRSKVRKVAGTGRVRRSTPRAFAKCSSSRGSRRDRGTRTRCGRGRCPRRHSRGRAAPHRTAADVGQQPHPDVIGSSAGSSRSRNSSSMWRCWLWAIWRYWRPCLATDKE